MTYRTIDFTAKDAICTLTMKRPEITLEMIREIAEACGEIVSDSSVKVVIITGTGKIFSRGADPSEIGSMNAMAVHLQSTTSSISQLTCPVIAAINGDAIGRGLEMALACDIRIAVESARFGMPQIKSGHIPQEGGTQLLPRIVGRAKATELILTGETIGAKEALDAGLITKIVPVTELIPSVKTLSETMAAQSPLALKHAKEAILKGLDMTLEQGLRLEADLYLLLHTTEDRTEGIRAFLEKRQPKFKGK